MSKAVSRIHISEYIRNGFEMELANVTLSTDAILRSSQAWCASSILICTIGQGMTLGHTGSLLPALQAKDSPIKVDIDSASWLASAMGPAIIVGTVLACCLMKWLGRRYSFLLILLPATVGWSIIYVAQSYTVLLIGRILTAITTGASHVIGVNVIGEFTSPENRGMFLNLKTAGISLGSTIIHILGNYLHWRTIAIVALIPHVIALLITYTWPESPTWLATRKQFEKCKEEFYWLRGRNEKSVQEVTELIKVQNEKLAQPKNKMSALGKILIYFKTLMRKDFLKPLLISIVAFVLLEASGRHYFPTYALQIMEEALQTDTLPYYFTLCVDLIITCTVIFSSFLVRVMKRRTLLFTSGMSSLCFLLLTSSYIFLVSSDMLSKNSSWIVISLIVLYFTSANLGCTSLPLALHGELFSVAHREIGAAVLGIINSLILTGFVKATPYLLNATKLYGTFATFAILIASTILVLYFILPETKDKTLQEIENYFNYGIYTIDEQKDDVCVKMVIEKQEVNS